MPTAHRLPLGLTRSSASTIALALMLGALAPLALRRARRPGQVDALALLALLGLFRCVADPTPLQYNFVDVLIPLAAWEAVSMQRVPVVTVAAMGTVWLGTGRLVDSPSVASALLLSGAVALAVYLAVRVFPLGAGRAGVSLIFRGREPITGS